MRTTLYILSLLILVALDLTPAYTQESTIDSLRKNLTHLPEDTNRVHVLNELSLEYALNSDFNSALSYAQEALSLSKKLRFTPGEGYALSTIAYVEFQKGNFAAALDLLFSALKIYEALGIKGDISTTLQTIAAINFHQGDEDEALKNLLRALELRKEINATFAIAQTNNSIAEIYARQGKLDIALAKYNESLKIFEQPGSPDWGIPYSLGEIGRIYEKQGDAALKSGEPGIAKQKYLDAREKYLATLASWEKLGRKDGVTETFVYLGNVNMKLGIYSSARSHLESALKEAIISAHKLNLRETYKSLTALDSMTGDYRQALAHYKMYTLYRDSLANEEITRKSVQLAMQYDFDKKEAITKAEQENKNAEATRIQNIQLFAIASLFMLILIIVYIAMIQWRNNKQRRQANILLTQQKEKIESTLRDLKATQNQLIQSEKMASLGELTAGIAHEIQNPLNFVNNFSEVNAELIDELNAELAIGNLQQAKEIGGHIKENEEKIIFHGKRADAIVKGMLQHSRASSGVKEPTDINALVDEYLRLAYHGLRAKDKSFIATLKTDFDNSLGLLNIVPQDIGRVILNLITNAFYAVSEKKKQHPDSDPKVEVMTRKLNDKIEIRVSDNGNGIPQHVLDKVFQPFFTTKPAGQGTGLGLSLSYDIIKAHGGEIKVITQDDQGTEFIIHLPILTA